MTPTHVEVNRCAGSCHNFKESCVSTKVVGKVVRVLLAKCGITVSRCDKECASVEVEEDVECGCQCGLTAQDCSPDQELMKDQCVCECKDRESEKNCHDSGRVWDRLTCSCQRPVTSVSVQLDSSLIMTLVHVFLTLITTKFPRMKTGPQEVTKQKKHSSLGKSSSFNHLTAHPHHPHSGKKSLLS